MLSIFPLTYSKSLSFFAKLEEIEKELERLKIPITKEIWNVMEHASGGTLDWRWRENI